MWGGIAYLNLTDLTNTFFQPQRFITSLPASSYPVYHTQMLDLLHSEQHDDIMAIPIKQNANYNKCLFVLFLGGFFVRNFTNSAITCVIIRSISFAAALSFITFVKVWMNHEPFVESWYAAYPDRKHNNMLSLVFWTDFFGHCSSSQRCHKSWYLYFCRLMHFVALGQENFILQIIVVFYQYRLVKI